MRRSVTVAYGKDGHDMGVASSECMHYFSDAYGRVRWHAGPSEKDTCPRSGCVSLRACSTACIAMPGVCGWLGAAFNRGRDKWRNPAAYRKHFPVGRVRLCISCFDVEMAECRTVREGQCRLETVSLFLAVLRLALCSHSWDKVLLSHLATEAARSQSLDVVRIAGYI